MRPLPPAHPCRAPAFPRWLATLVALAVAALAPSTANAACTVTATVATDLGKVSPAAVQQAAVPSLRSPAGLTCDASLLVLLSGNYVRARFTSQNAMKLLRTGDGGTIAYTASADPNATVAFTQGGTVDYMQNNLLNLLGLLGGSSANLPFFVKPGGSLPPVGTYTDRIRIDWSWKLCPGGISLAGLCVGTLDSGTGQSIVDVTLTVAAQSVMVSVTSATTWDPVAGTNYPKALPGSRRRAAVAVTNPDLVALDATGLAIAVPTPAGALVALDGDGATSGAAIRLADGAATGGVALSYTDATSTADDVDFSSDGGITWSYAPIPGNIASEAAITHVRLRPRGSFAKGGTFTAWIPYLVR